MRRQRAHRTSPRRRGRTEVRTLPDVVWDAFELCNFPGCLELNRPFSTRIRVRPRVFGAFQFHYLSQIVVLGQPLECGLYAGAIGA
jgi:hypothetical protein